MEQHLLPSMVYAKDFKGCLNQIFAARALVVAPFFSLFLKSLKSPFLLDVADVDFWIYNNFKQSYPVI